MAATKKAPAKKTTAATKSAAKTTAAATNSAAKTTATATKSAAAATKSAAKTTASATKSAAKTTASATKSAAKTTASATKSAVSTPTTAAVKKASAKAASTAEHAATSVADRVAFVGEQIQATAATMADTSAAKATEALKSFPSIDFSKLDVDTLKQFDPRKIEWSKFELPDLDRQKFLGAVRDAAYVIVGFGVLAVQRAQVRRRELAEAISNRFGGNKHQIEELIASFEARITKFDDAVEARVDHAVSMIGDRLPDQAEMLLNQVHSVAKTARKQVRGLLSSAA